MSPGTLQGDTIYDLPAVANAAQELPGGLWEVEVPAGPAAGAYVNKKLTTEQFVDYLLAQAGGGTPTLADDAQLDYLQTELANDRAPFTPAVRYAITGDWNATGDDTQVVYVQAATAVSLERVGTLRRAGQADIAVIVDVVAGTAVPIVPPNVIYVDANGNIIVGLDRSHSIAGDFNSIYGGEDCHIDNPASSFCSIKDSSGSSIYGGRNNAITSSSGSTIPADCSNVVLLNCDNFDAPAGVSNATYINNVRVGGSGPAGAVYRDPYGVGDDLAVTAAVTDASNTWSNGDLTAYGSAALQNAGAPPADPAGQNGSVLVGTADVAHPDTFDKADASGTGAWRYVYGRRNDGTSGWTRIPKG